MIIVLIGVAGAGKTTIGRQLADELGWRLSDTDDLHPPENIRRMASGQALTEEDREPWLNAAEHAFDDLRKTEQDAVFAFPGLTRQHRSRVLKVNSSTKIVHLVGSPELIRIRLLRRQGHFFPASLLESQFDLLEPPPDALTVDVSPCPREIVSLIRRQFNI